MLKKNWVHVCSLCGNECDYTLEKNEDGLKDKISDCCYSEVSEEVVRLGIIPEQALNAGEDINREASKQKDVMSITRGMFR